MTKADILRLQEWQLFSRHTNPIYKMAVPRRHIVPVSVNLGEVSPRLIRFRDAFSPASQYGRTYGFAGQIFGKYGSMCIVMRHAYCFICWVFIRLAPYCVNASVIVPLLLFFSRPASQLQLLSVSVARCPWPEG